MYFRNFQLDNLLRTAKITNFAPTYKFSKMKKTALQIQDFLKVQPIKSNQDYKRILGICQSDGSFQPNHTYSIDANTGITVLDYIDWVDNRFGAGDICNIDSQTVICGKSGFKVATIVGRLSGDKVIATADKVSQNELTEATEAQKYDFYCALLSQHLQFSLKEMKLVERYVPQPGDRVIFTSPTKSGLGVIKEIHFDTDQVDFFCYYINETGEVGYSMDCKNITTLSDVIFEPMNNSSQRQTKGNGIYLQRKLNKELARFGKVWNEKLHRIEPLSPMVPVGEKYWYLNDKMELIADVERGGIVSRRRYYAANYFKTMAEGLTYQGKITTLLRSRYGLPDPNYNN